ncbi:MAG: dTDP-4-dehydrorhamnose 3,5-epimerase [Gammaproteobacteria bacterium]
MRVTPTRLPEVLLIEPEVHGDARGFFLEVWQRERYRAAGVEHDFVQDNVSFSARGVLRGLHFQNPHAQGKLVYVLQGEVYDVAVDIRQGSPRFGQWVGMLLSGEGKQQLYIPPGFAHGFCVTSETALFAYKCTDVYSPADEGVVAWDDPAIGIDWPIADPSLSSRDASAPRLAGLAAGRLPSYTEGEEER